MKTEEQSCCFCFNIASAGNNLDVDILDLLKFLVLNVDTKALENSTVCDGCLNKITETYEYKRRNLSRALKETIDSEKPILCQKCEKICKRGESFPLVDCITQIDWSDFVSYLFVDQDSESLKSSQICDSCRISLSNIQNFLRLIFVYDPNKMKCDMDSYCSDINPTGNKNLVEDKTEIKQEFEYFIMEDKTKIENLINDNKTEIEDSDDFSYADFKCKNEEVELKLESIDNKQSTYRYEVDVGNEMTSSGGPNESNCNNHEGVNSQECSNRIIYDLKVYSNIRDFKCIYCSKEFAEELIFHDHLLRIHKCRDGVTSKIHECDTCNYETTEKDRLLKHKLQHGVKVRNEKYKCQNCTYETNIKKYLTKHVKIHYNIRDFKCTFCSKEFCQKRRLDDHLIKIHKNSDSVTSTIYGCDKCSYSTTTKNGLWSHKLTHIKGSLEQYKCLNCSYQTYHKYYLIRHIRMHNNYRKFKCTLCSKAFTQKIHFNNHLIRVHKSKDNVASKVHQCDKCSYETTMKSHLLKHQLKHVHDVKLEVSEKYKCQNCMYETHNELNLFKHIQRHRDFTCTFCSRNFSAKRHLDDHLLKIHKSKNVSSKIHGCDKCGYSTTKTNNLLRHKLRHGIKVEALKKQKCQFCIYETYEKCNLKRHMKVHNNILDNLSTK